MRILGLGILAAMLASSAFGQEGAVSMTSPFQNHLRSVMMVSPAQIYQTSNVKTDFQLGYESNERSLDAGTETTNTLSMTDVYGAAVYSFPDTNVTLAVEADFATGGYEKDNGTNTTDLDYSKWQVKPQLAYTMGSVILGAAVKMIGETAEVGTTDFDNTYMVYVPGVTFAQNNFEIGLVFETEAQDAGNAADKELMYESPAKLIAHGRYAMSPELALGAIVANTHYEGINDTTNDDQLNLRATAEYTQATWRMEGDIGYNTAYYKEDVNMAPANIATIELGTAADFKVNQNAMVGGLVRYEFGSDEVSGTDLAVSNFDIGVRGNWSF